VWQLQDAKNKFSEVVNAALKHGPQIITRRGVETVIVLSYEEYRRLRNNRKKLSDIFRKPSVIGAEIDLTRDRSPLRDDPEL
jgi:prevent-host-death family protein